MESPRGSSVIQLKRCARSTAFHGEPKRELCHSIKKVCQEHGLPSQDHGEPKRELCHHHGISQKNPFDIVIYLYVCVFDL